MATRLALQLAHLVRRGVVHTSLVGTGLVAGCATDTRTDVCTTIRTDQTCPEGADAKAQLPERLCESPEQAVVSIVDGPRRVEDESTIQQGFFESDLPDDPTLVACCYDVGVRPIPGSGCVIGRPLRGPQGSPSTAPIVARTGWTRA